jgi:glyoxylase-like metal-dependent hydrolase (beta-lactamase superfamily II)
MKSILSFIFSAFSISLIAQRNFDGVQIEPIQVSENVYVLFGSGGNIALVTGENQNYIIDDQFAPLSDKINFTIQQINPKSVAYVLNTHWHGDHTGGNANFAENGATIIAHDRVYDRLKTGPTIDSKKHTSCCHRGNPHHQLFRSVEAPVPGRC